MKFAYADPPYYGMANKYPEHPEAAIYDTLEGHQALIDRLEADFDGWAMSLSSPTLKDILPLCPRNVRVMAWVKPFASWKPNVQPAYAWEPVIFKPMHKADKTQLTVRDWVACNITLKRGLTGAKPEGFCRWIFEAAYLKPEDEFFDLFPGTGAVTRAYEAWRAEREPVALAA